MKIYFGYIEGISRIDTPYFSTLTEQEDYFDSHEVASIENTFYPPHYNNVIKVDSDDIDFNTQLNYIWFEYLDKRYYYFVDDIEYISETVANIYITMDTIQTYMFNISVTNVIIERKFINRWVGTKINRAYIRENVSEGTFYPVNITIYNNDITKWIYVIYKTENENVKFASTSLETPNGTYNVPTIPSILPVSYRVINDSQPSSQQIGDTDLYAAYLSGVVSKDWVVDVCLVPFIPFEQFDIVTINNELHCYTGIDSVSGNRYWSNDKFTLPNAAQGTDGKILSPSVVTGAKATNNNNIEEHVVKTKIYNNNFNAGYIKSTSILTSFSSHFITQLMDSNYDRFIFGDDYANTTIPLELLEETAIHSRYYFDYSAKGIVFQLNNYTVFTDNVFRNTVIDNALALPALKNSPWENYVSQNRNRWIGAIGNTALTILSKGAVKSIANSSSQSEIEEILSNKKSYTPKRHLLSKKSQRSINSRLNDIEERNKQFKASSGIELGSSIIGQAIVDSNYWQKPVEVTFKGEMSPVCSNGWQIYLKHERVIDYEQCANYFHRNGFLVNEHINAVANIFTYVNSRYYFNVLKLSDVDLHLHDVIEDNATLAIIKDRFADGLRLWNITNGTIGDFTYDNVEKDFI